MKVNNITSTDYRAIGDMLEIDFSCTVEEALGINPSIIEVCTDDGDFVESFVGYSKKSATVDAVTKKVTLTLVRGADGAVINSMSAMQAQNNDLRAQVEEQALAIEELASMLAEMEASNG